MLLRVTACRVDCNDLSAGAACDVGHSGFPKMRRNQIGQALALIGRWRCVTAALVLSLTILGAGAASATPGDILFIKADEVSLHAVPDAGAPVILRLKAGHKLIEFKRRGAWIKVGVFGAVGKVGWVRRNVAAGRKPESVGLDLSEVIRGPGAARSFGHAPRSRVANHPVERGSRGAVLIRRASVVLHPHSRNLPPRTGPIISPLAGPTTRPLRKH